MAGVLVTVADLRALGYCMRGSRELAARLGIDWALFLQQGISSDELDKFDDAMVRELVSQARRREAAE